MNHCLPGDVGMGADC